MDFSKVKAHLDRLVQNGLPFAQVVVTKGRETVFSYNVGWADAEKTVPISDRNLCWCYSNSKVYTAVCLMRLVEAGKVALDDPVSKFLPEWEGVRYLQDGEILRAEQAPTLRQLITMTGGLSYNYGQDHPHFAEAIAKPGVTTREAVAALAQDPLIFEPGTDYRYGLGHDVIAAVVEAASGLRFSEYVQKNLFDPLGIADTGFHPTEEQYARFATEYRWDGETYTPCGRVNKFIFSENYDSGGAGMFSRPQEYCKLLTALACGGTGADGYLVLKPETVDLLAENQLAGKPWDSYHTNTAGQTNQGYRAGYGYGHGVRVHMYPAESCCKTSVGEFGWSGAAGAYSVVDRGRQLAIAYAEHVLRSGAKATDAKPSYVRKTVVKALKNLVCEAIDS